MSVHIDAESSCTLKNATTISAPLTSGTVRTWRRVVRSIAISADTGASHISEYSGESVLGTRPMAAPPSAASRAHELEVTKPNQLWVGDISAP
jgi:hypothetical protein